MSTFITPLATAVLSRGDVKLEPLSLAHANDLRAAAADGKLWRLRVTSVPEPENTEAYIEAALKAHADGHMLPFAVRHLGTDQIIGCTRYHDIIAAVGRLEIGYTWYARRYQRTVVNTECKLLLLTHAFEHLDAIAVEFRTHWHNQASRSAIARLGAKQDGVLRNHQQMADGSYRDTVVFSIINHEWLAVKASLSHRLRPGTWPAV